MEADTAKYLERVMRRETEPQAEPERGSEPPPTRTPETIRCPDDNDLFSSVELCADRERPAPEPEVAREEFMDALEDVN